MALTEEQKQRIERMAYGCELALGNAAYSAKRGDIQGVHLHVECAQIMSEAAFRAAATIPTGDHWA